VALPLVLMLLTPRSESFYRVGEVRHVYILVHYLIIQLSHRATVDDTLILVSHESVVAWVVLATVSTFIMEGRRHANIIYCMLSSD